MHEPVRHSMRPRASLPRRRRRSGWTTLAALTALTTASLASGAIPGQELWDASHGDEFTGDGTVITHRGNVYTTYDSEFGHVTVAYDTDGQRLWDREASGENGDVEARGLVARKKQVFIMANDNDPSDTIDVTAYDEATGATQWNKRVEVSSSSLAGGLAALRGKVYAAGSVRGPEVELTFRAFLQIYDAADGAEIDNVTLDEESRFQAVAVKGNQVFVAGFAEATSAARGRIDDFAFLVQSRDGDTAELQWEQRVNVEGRRDSAHAVIAKGKRVYVAGRSDDPGGADGLLVAALDTATGEELWTYTFDDDTSDVERVSMAFRGGKVFVSMTLADAGVVTALRGRDGRELWQISEQLAEATSFNAVAAGKGIVAAVGQDDKADGTKTLLVVGFNPKTGAGLWLAEAGEIGGSGRAAAVTVGKDAVYVSGRIAAPNASSEMTTRAYATQ